MHGELRNERLKVSRALRNLGHLKGHLGKLSLYANFVSFDSQSGAGSGNRTRVACLEGRNFTIKLYPQNFPEKYAPADASVNGFVAHSTYLRKQIHADCAVHGKMPSPGNHQRESGSDEENWKFDGLEG